MSDYKIQYTILKDIIALSCVISQITFTFKIRKIQFLNHFIFWSSYSIPKYLPHAHTIGMEGRLSQIINLGFSSYFMTKKG